MTKQNIFSPTQAQRLQELSLKPSVAKYKGKLDKQDRYKYKYKGQLPHCYSQGLPRYHGDGEARYTNCDIFYGTWRHGLREGAGCLVSMVGGVECSVEGVWREDRLEGWAEETYQVGRDLDERLT